MGTQGIPAAVVEHILLGPLHDRRQLQDSPVLGDVWVAYAAKPGSRQDLLITPLRSEVAGSVAKAVRDRLPAPDGEAGGFPYRIAYVQGLVAAELTFKEVLRAIAPITQWWQEPSTQESIKLIFGGKAHLVDRVTAILRAVALPEGQADAVSYDSYTALERFITIAALILEAEADPPPDDKEEFRQWLAGKADNAKALTDGLRPWVEAELSPKAEKRIFQIALNRIAAPALEKSVPAVKADAARQLFSVDCREIAWAVLDSGIQADHEAFKGADGASRIKGSYDFGRFRDIVSMDSEKDAELVAALAKATGLDAAKVTANLTALSDDAVNERPIQWALVDELICLKDPPRPVSHHGTHVAGIIGAAKPKRAGEGGGMCPDIQLYDLRVLGRTMKDTEFAIIAALQFIRYINERHNFVTIHGANLSLSIPHSVRNYACGRTPVCEECERLVESGVVVVAAAGNRGYHNFQTAEGAFESYAAFSITDPGNADGVVTVGATHRNWPHTYGVSFFSSRGPTGDGRMKPDLVAPGERIRGPILDGGWGPETGTSMAAPHVSGAAAMLMGRYSELVGRPRRVKQILCDTATDLGRERSFQGSGMVDVLRALQSV